MLRTNLPNLILDCEERLKSRYLFLAELKEIDEALIQANKELTAPTPQQAPADETTSLLASDREQKAAAVRIDIDALLKPKVEALLAETGRLLHEAAGERKAIPDQKINSRQPADAKIVFSKREMINHMLQHTSGYLTVRDIIRLAQTSASLNKILKTITFTQRCLVINASPENILLFNPRRIMPGVQQTFTGIHKLLEEARKKDSLLLGVIKEDFVLQRNRGLVERIQQRADPCLTGLCTISALLIGALIAFGIEAARKQDLTSIEKVGGGILLLYVLTLCGLWSGIGLRSYLRDAAPDSIASQLARARFDNETQRFFSSGAVVPESKLESKQNRQP